LAGLEDELEKLQEEQQVWRIRPPYKIPPKLVTPLFKKTLLAAGFGVALPTQHPLFELHSL